MIFEITIPVLNEEKSLERNILCVLDFLSKHNLDNFRICIADNGSTDQTLPIAIEIEKKFPNLIRIVSLPKKGVGLALKKAWETSNADIVGYMDLDLATDLMHLLDVQRAFLSSQKVDIIYGTRLAKDSLVVGRKYLRSIISVIFNLIVRSVFRVSISDSMCGFKFYRRNIVNKLISHGAQSDGWFFCAETLIVGKQLDLTARELPVKWTDDPESKVKILKLTLEYIKCMWKLKRGTHE